jgi:hypothetical protein
LTYPPLRATLQLARGYRRKREAKLSTTTEVTLHFALGDEKQIAPGLQFYRGDGPAGGDERVLMAQAAYDAVDSLDLMTLYSESVVFLGANAQNFIREAPSTHYPNGRLRATTTEASSVGANIAGSSPSGEAAPPQLSMVWSFYSDVPGPRGRGRWYGPCPAQADINEAGRLSAELTDAFRVKMNALAALVADSTDPAHEQVVQSRKYDLTSPVTTDHVFDVVRTQRRRALRR